MAEPLKNLLLNEGTVRAAAIHLKRAWRGFPADAFERYALRGLDELELKARAMHIADALEATLPQDFARAASVIEASLAPPLAEDNESGVATGPGDDGIAGWLLWSAGEFVVRRGLDQPERSLAVLHAITQRFTAEWAIRPFIVAHPALCFATLERWVDDPSVHVRRLVSEGSRPRLPWGLQLKALIADPTPTLPLLQTLQDDTSEYVRRSVANHLNDIAKDHPQLIAQWLEHHLPGASPARQALLRHASRTLIKRGDARVMAAWGYAASFDGGATLKLKPARVAFGDAVTLTLVLKTARTALTQTLVIDYVVHHVNARGGHSPKVYKGWTRSIAPGSTVELVKRHALRPITTRAYYPGVHRVEVLVNGMPVAAGAFTLRMEG
jgi:3-methyladenine DNA glycosylase AlkC